MITAEQQLREIRIPQAVALPSGRIVPPGGYRAVPDGGSVAISVSLFRLAHYPWEREEAPCWIRLRPGEYEPVDERDDG